MNSRISALILRIEIANSRQTAGIQIKSLTAVIRRPTFEDTRVVAGT